MEFLDLADWRTRVASLYLSDVDIADFRRRKDELFATHPQSPVLGQDFGGLAYFDVDESSIVDVPLAPAEGEFSFDTGNTDGVVTYARIGILETPFGPLTLWWTKVYGGGLFLPVRDGTARTETYGGGRYLTDTIKGTHGRGLIWLGGERVRLDFNYLYHPSCAYSDRWTCPLAPEENRISTPIRAGERLKIPT
jgi:uncharacterized protein (DUF1684 family)